MKLSEILRQDIENIINSNIEWEKLEESSVLITGATGMLGGYILRTLVELNRNYGYNMNLFILIRHPEKLDESLREEVQIICQSVSEKINTEEKFDFVIHAASPASPLIMKDDPVGTIAANTLGTFYTLDIARKSDAKGYLYISSREIYGQPYENQEIFTEDTYGFVDPLNPRSCYPEGKKAAETMCMCYKQQYGLNTKIARLAHTFGPGMSIDDGRVQADFLKNVVNNQDIVLKSEGTAIRTYTYVGDAVKALFYILLNSEDVVYNISSEADTVSIKQLAQTLLKEFPERNLKLVFNIPESDKGSGCAPFTIGILGSDKIKKLGWTPSYRLGEGLRRTVMFLEGK